MADIGLVVRVGSLVGVFLSKFDRPQGAAFERTASTFASKETLQQPLSCLRCLILSVRISTLVPLVLGCSQHAVIAGKARLAIGGDVA